MGFILEMNMKIYFLIITVFLMFCISSCGSKKNSSQTQSSVVEEFQDFLELEKKLSEHSVVCGELDCPGSVAKLVFWGKSKEEDSYYLAVCSGTLFENKYIITNSHCIPEEIKFNGANCSKQLKVLFPKTAKFNDESARCQNIIQVFKEDEGQPDLAIIELERNVLRSNIVISRNNFLESSKVYAYTMNPTNENNRTLGVIKRKDCLLSIDNLMTLTTKPDSAAAVIYGDQCNVIGGNSGSGLFNESNQYIGTIFAKFEIFELKKLFNQHYINHSLNSYMGMVYNVGCLTSLSTSTNSFECDMTSNNEIDFEAGVERAKENAQLNHLSDSMIKYELQNGFKLKLTQLERSSDFYSVSFFKNSWKKIFYEKTSIPAFSKKLLLEKP